ncbi:MAG: FecR family protein, partial [Terriglobales bacterium]
GELHITTTDHGVVALRPNTRVRIREYRAKGDAQDKSVLELLRGTFRAVTGLIGRNYPSRYSIRTPTAAIGIRGTDHEPAYIPAPEPGETPEGEPGTYDKVNEGETFIQNDRGRIAVKPNQSGFAPLAAIAPQILRSVPKFYRITDHEQLIEQQADQLKKKLLEKPRQIQQQMEQMKNKPQEEGEKRMRREMDRFRPRW